jgi:general stress protein 26
MPSQEFNQMAWLPASVERLLEVALVGELTVIGRNGRPVTHPLIPLYDGETIYLHSSTLFSKKLEHIKRDPHVALSLSDPIALRGEPARATIQGTARVIEDDPHAQWEPLILDLWRRKEPVIDQFLKARVALPLFFERAVIAITPERCLLWPDGDTATGPQRFAAPSSREAA